MDIDCDFLVIGSGIAGLSFALQVAEHGTVAIVTKRRLDDTNTNRAQGGIAAVVDEADDFDQHVRDTLEAGAGLCHRDAVELIVREGPTVVRQLMEWGVEFTREGSGALALGREGGHSRNRIVHAADLTGAEIERALLVAVRAHRNILLFEDHVSVDLITEHQLRGRKAGRRPSCWGAYVLDVKAGRVRRFRSRNTVLATGGAGQIWRHTTNPEVATGDGVAMAYRAGARVGNLEFMQFHPTALFHPRERSFLISEAVRGFGGILVNARGVAFMENEHPMKHLAPRDIVARAIDKELKTTGAESVFLDITHKPAEDIRARFPNIHEKCLSLGIDITKEPIPVVPAAHYMCGGVLTDLHARTDIRNLHACGEVALTGVHGANRLASNSLLEAVVFANQASRDVIEGLDDEAALPDVPPWDDSDTFDVEEWVLLNHDVGEIRGIMWDYVGIVRSDVRLARANRRLELIWTEVEEFYRRAKVTQELIALRNMASVAALVVRCAMRRKESRGLHYTTDHPRRNEDATAAGSDGQDTLLRAQRIEHPSEGQPPSINGKLSEYHDIPGPSDHVQ